MCGGQYGYIMVSKFGLHQIATHSPIWNHILHNCKSSKRGNKIDKAYLHDIRRVNGQAIRQNQKTTY